MEWFAMVVMEFIIQLIPHQFANAVENTGKTSNSVSSLFILCDTLCVYLLTNKYLPYNLTSHIYSWLFFFTDCNNNRIDKKKEKRKYNVKKTKYAAKQQCRLKMF